MSIKRKLTLMTMSISTAAVVITVMSITSYLIYDMHRSKMESLALTAAIAGDRNSAALIFQYKEQAQSNLEIYRQSPSIQAACIYTAQGALFAGYESSDAGDACRARYDEIPEKLSGLLSARTPISKNGKTVGFVYLASDMREIYSYVSKISLISAAAIILVLGVTLCLTLYFRRTISDPILELASTAQTITASGNYGLKARADYPDETGMLARAFNEMLGEVRKRDAELMRANEGLEEKIALRTHELEEAKQRAEQANEAKSGFLRNMSHEFRTPLHAILSFSSYGVKEFKAGARDTLRKYFEQIKTSSERLGKLVNEVLDLARLEHGPHAFSVAYTDLRALAELAVEGVRPLINNKGITLAMDQAESPVGILCDQDKILQVITNLLSNAIKFTPAGKSITLATRTRTANTGEESMLSLTDEGVGIPEDEKEAIFESFRQSSRTNTGAGGTGLGLAICRNIIAAHHGTIWAENNSATAGARFTFCLPAATERTAQHTMMPPQEMPHEALYKA